MINPNTEEPQSVPTTGFWKLSGNLANSWPHEHGWAETSDVLWKQEVFWQWDMPDSKIVLGVRVSETPGQHTLQLF